MIDAGQNPAARALLNSSQADLPKVRQWHVATIRRLEAATALRGAAETLWKVEKALERSGVEFIPADASNGPGFASEAPIKKTKKLDDDRGATSAERRRATSASECLASPRASASSSFRLRLRRGPGRSPPRARTGD